ncbi:MAG: sigma 54-interacting transcriptional regulator [Deltaproteobacteria bacterium]|nr:sigma 54-interacting transcriptional regulator [Deltaproteobacteria bacterium]MBW2072151.1 sigma 54-interacting transcriptional regulator [Deltaproteobacteria bacterium]
MKEADKSREQLLEELQILRGRLAELEASAAEHRRVEEKLQEAKDYYQSVLFNMHEDIIIIDRDYRITDANKAFLHTTGRKRQEVVGEPCYKISHGYNQPCDKHGEECVLPRVFATGQPQSCRHQHLRPDGSKIWVDLLLSPMRYQMGAVTHIIETMRDITDLVKAEEALRASEQKFRALFDFMPTMAFVIDKEHRLIACNRTFVRVLGNQIGKKTLELGGVSQSLKQFWYGVEKQVMESKNPTWYVQLIDTARRGRLYLDKRMEPIRDQDGNVCMVIGIASDITNDVKRQIALAEEVEELRVRLWQKGGPTIIGKSRVITEVLNRIKAISATDTTVLITGDSGTGKEPVAEAIHNLSKRAKGPLIKVNCAALPESIIESELFGHVKGAFSGAVSTKIGRFEAANGGTIFLDEIADVSPAVQLRLLRVLEEKKIAKVGDYKPIRVDVRIIAATNQNLESLVHKGRFRKDLYYRLNVFKIHVPLLRGRLDDIPLLVIHFLKQYSRTMGKEITSVSNEVMTLLRRHSWPGNVRELMNVIESACVLCEGKTIELEHLPPLFERWIPHAAINKEMEIREALRRTRGNKTEAARILGIARRTLYRRMERYGIVTDVSE